MPYIPQPFFTSSYPVQQTYVPAGKECIDYHACKMKVEGTGIVRVQPDIATASLGVVTENVQLRQAQAENSRIITAVISALKELGVESGDIQTQSYTIEPQYDFVDGKQVFRGYRVRHILKVTIRDIRRTGEIIDASVASGANIVNNISFSVSQPSNYYQQALKAAIDDAFVKAATIGNRLQVRVNPVPERIVEERYEAPPMPFLMQAADTSTPIQPGQIEIAARIEAVFRYVCYRQQEN